MKITYEYLWTHDACDAQVKLFSTLYPKGADLNRKNLIAAANQGLDIEWILQRLSDNDEWAAYVAEIVDVRILHSGPDATLYDEAHLKYLRIVAPIIWRHLRECKALRRALRRDTIKSNRRKK